MYNRSIFRQSISYNHKSIIYYRRMVLGRSLYIKFSSVETRRSIAEVQQRNFGTDKSK